MRDALVEITEWANGGLAARLFRCRVDNTNVDYPNALKFFPLQLDPATLPPLDTSANVKAYGTQIRMALATHPAIGAELAQIFQTNSRATLQFFIGPSAGECFRWETLCESPPLSFLALRDVCTVSRLAYVNGKDSEVRAFNHPLRMAAFLSPAGVSAADEFAGICQEVGKACGNGLDIECTVYLGEQSLLDQAMADISLEKLPGIQVAPIPSETVAIDQLLRQRPVELLHFFCHGISGAGVQALELATISDKDTGKKSGSVVLSLERLNEILVTTGKTWVTVLNSCSGAAAVDQLHSMALTLAKRGSPFTVGMAEPISGVDATIFSKAFYQALFAIMRTGLVGAPVGSSVMLDLAPAVINARRMVYNQYQVAPPDAFGRWALPLLYERGGPLTVQVAPPLVVDQAMKLRIDTVAGALRNLPVGTPDQMRDDILALLNKDPVVPMSVRPSRFGVIGDP